MRSADEDVHGRAADRDAVGVPALALKALAQARDVERAGRNRADEPGEKAHHEGQRESRHGVLSSHGAFAGSAPGRRLGP